MEHQKKLFATIRIDNEKNLAISEIQASRKKLEQKLHNTELENASLRRVLQQTIDEHNVKILKYLEQVRKYQEEYKEALDLASEYKNKIDLLENENLEFSRSCRNKMCRFKKNFEIFANLLEKTRKDCCKLIQEIGQESKDLLSGEEKLNKERLKLQELTIELHKKRNLLDLMETELRLSRKEKEALRLRLKDEIDKNRVLNNERSFLLGSLEERRLAEV